MQTVKTQHQKLASFLESHRLSLLAITALSALALWSAHSLGMSWGSIAWGVPNALQILGTMIPPSAEYLGRVGQGMLESFHIALLSTILAAIIAVPAGFLAARNAGKRPILYSSIRLILNSLCTLPVMLLAVIIMPGVGPGPLCSVLAISIYSVGILGKLFAETFESIDTNLLEAFTPYVLPKFLSLALQRLETNIRVATVLGLVGAGGIGQILLANLTYRIWPNVGMIVLGIIIMVTVTSQVGMWLRAKLA